MKDIEKKSEEFQEDEVLKAKLQRNKDTGKLQLYLRVAPEVEEFMKQHNRDFKQSGVWHSGEEDYHEFYKKPRNYTNDIKKLFRGRYNDFGQDFVKDGKVNIAMLRTKGVSEGVNFVIDNNNSEESLIRGMEQLKDFVRELYRQFIREVQIEATLKYKQM